MKILGISSSVRKASCNNGLLMSAKYLGITSMPNVTMEIANIHELPQFNLDYYLTNRGKNDPIQTFHRQLAECDSILFAATEYPYG